MAKTVSPIKAPRNRVSGTSKSESSNKLSSPTSSVESVVSASVKSPESSSAPKSMPSNQTDGASVTPTGKTIFEILNPTFKCVYQQDNVNDYEAYIKSLSLADLQLHSVSVGSVIPVASRERLLSRLVEEYCRFMAKTNGLKISTLSKAVTASRSGGTMQDDGLTPEARESIERILGKHRRG